jgi:hypothetical protein
LKDLDITRRIILKWILDKVGREVVDWIRFSVEEWFF